MKISWAGYRWIRTGERCCMTHRLVPADNTASPCLAVVYECCSTNHKQHTPHCPLPLTMTWTAFAGTRMSAGLFRTGEAASLDAAKARAIGALGMLRAERRVASEAVAVSE